MNPAPRLSAPLTLRLMWRETRGSWRRFGFFLLCLAIGVTAIVCVAGLTRNLDRRIQLEARQLLGADLMLAGSRPPTPEIDLFLEQRDDIEVTGIKELVTMAARPSKDAEPGPSQLVELEVIDGAYPFYGQLETVPPDPLPRLLAENGVVVGPDLLRRLDVSIGDVVRIGGRNFTITAELVREPGQIVSPFSLGPRVLVAEPGFAATSLEQLGSRITYRRLIRLPTSAKPADLTAFAEELQRVAGKTGPYRVETYLETRQDLRQALDRAARFLGLVAVLSLLLGGLGIAQTTRAWLASRLDDIAILRCLGLRPGDVLRLYLAQTTLLALAGSLVGVAAGVAVQAYLIRALPQILAGSDLSLWQPMVYTRGLGLGLGIALVFSLRALVSIRSVPPLRALRSEVEPIPTPRLVEIPVFAIVAGGIWAVASVQAVSVIEGGLFALGIAAAAGILYAIALALTRLLAPVARALRALPVRQGLLAMSRPGAATLGAIVALGIGVLLIVGLQLVRDRLTDQLREDIPADSPTAFLVNIQPDQWPAIEDLLSAGGAQNIHSVPFVTARLRAIDGIDVDKLADDHGEESEDSRRWALTREQRLTYMETLPPDNRIIEGELWSLPGVAEVSVEEEFAHDLGVEVGSTLRFDVQGIPIDLRVTSLRSVEWRTFGINFFLVVEPGVLDQAPHQRVATATLPTATEQQIQDQLAASFPQVTLIKIREILERIVAILGYLSRGVAFIGGFTVIAGIVILAGGVSADSVRRRHQIALLKTLGMTQREIAVMLATEFSVIGTVAGLIGAAGASLLSWAVVTRGMDLSWQLEPRTLILAVVITLSLATVTGIVASQGALRQRPAAVLRGD